MFSFNVRTLFPLDKEMSGLKDANSTKKKSQHMLSNLPHQVKFWFRSSTKTLRGIQDLSFLERTLSVNTMHRHIKKAWGRGMFRELVLSPSPCLWKATRLTAPFLHTTVPMPSSKSNPVLGSTQASGKEVSPHSS